MKSVDEISSDFANGRLTMQNVVWLVAERDNMIKQCAIAEVALLHSIRQQHPDAPLDVVIGYFQAALSLAMEAPELGQMATLIKQRLEVKQ